MAMLKHNSKVPLDSAYFALMIRQYIGSGYTNIPLSAHVNY
jgi:hypothetical protein